VVRGIEDVQKSLRAWIRRDDLPERLLPTIREIQDLIQPQGEGEINFGQLNRHLVPPGWPDRTDVARN
jgi:hypothetical protein